MDVSTKAVRCYLPGRGAPRLARFVLFTNRSSSEGCPLPNSVTIKLSATLYLSRSFVLILSISFNTFTSDNLVRPLVSLRLRI